MNWINSLERRLGHLAIPHLIRIVVVFNGLVWLLMLANPYFTNFIDMRPDLVMQGQVWRLVSYIFIPPTVGPIWIIFALMFLWFLGEGLEQAWGSFRVNLFYLLGMIGTTIAAFFFTGHATNVFLNTSVLFAFATIFPNQIIQLFLIFPVKIKWIAFFSLFLVVMSFFGGSPAMKAAIVVSFANYLVFFARDLYTQLRETRENASRREEYDRKQMPADEPLHSCTVCSRTERSHPQLDFRISRDGNEYCIAHLPKKTEPPPVPQ